MKRIAIFALSVLILAQAYTFSQAEAQESRDDIVTVSVSVASPSYQTGDIIEIYGSVSISSDPLRAYDVAVILKAPNGNFIEVAQVTPASDGYYSKSIQSSESWKEGTYTVTANYDIKSASTSFSFSTTESVAIEEVVEVAGGLACGSGTHEADGFCIPDGSDSFGLSYDSASANGLILTAAIAFGIAVAIIIALRLIGKAGRSR